MKNNGFLKNAGILAAAGLLARLMGFLYRIPMQNILGDAGTGIYGAAFNLYLLFFVISAAGFPSAVSKMVSSRMAKGYDFYKILNISLLFSSFLGLISMLILFLFSDLLANFIGLPAASLSIRALAPTVFVVSIMSTFKGYFLGIRNSFPVAISQLLDQLINAIFSVFLVFVFIDHGIIYAAFGGTLATFFGAFVGFLVLLFIFLKNRRKVDFQKFKKSEKNSLILKELIATSIPIIAGTAIFSITNIIDTQMAMNLLTNAGFSSYEAKALFGQLNGKYVVITTLPVAVSSAIAMAVIPSISAAVAAHNEEEARSKVKTALKFAMLIAFPAAFGIGVLAEEILLFLFPNNPEGAILLAVGSVSILFLSLSQIATGILHGLSVLKVPVLAALIGAIIKIPLNFILISNPAINILGAIISTTICYLVASFINLFFVYKKAGVKPEFKNTFIKPFIASFIMGLSLLFLRDFHLFLAIVVGFCTFFAVLIILKPLTKAELSLIPFIKKFNR
ncbi:MAG: polysaccharide biosynthesis protein [Defluviitaleaceae bacterium]|nr:polysaccharide biosynthesis protein [Defluviitaleaceae bacterium]